MVRFGARHVEDASADELFPREVRHLEVGVVGVEDLRVHPIHRDADRRLVEGRAQDLRLLARAPEGADVAYPEDPPAIAVHVHAARRDLHRDPGAVRVDHVALDGDRFAAVGRLAAHPLEVGADQEVFDRPTLDVAAGALAEEAAEGVVGEVDPSVGRGREEPVR